MEGANSSRPAPRRARAVAALGVFDGVHRGHQALIDRVRVGARREAADPVVVTFDPPPARLFSTEPLGAFEITPCREKVRLLRALGVVRVLVLPFTRELASRTARGFVEDVLLREFDLAGVVVGHDFGFGANRQGNPELLRILGRRLGFWVEVVAPVTLRGERVSSTRIRALLRAGRVREAAARLGRELSIAGRVGSGQGLGKRELVPTANLDIDPDQILPAAGVYRVWARLGDHPRWPGVANVGPVPTLGTGHDRLVEVHIFDFDNDLHGQDLQVEFIDWMRAEQRFPDLESLRTAISEDLRRARKQFADEGYKPLATDNSV